MQDKQDDASRCKTMQGDVFFFSEIKRNDLFHTLHHGTELFVSYGIFCDEMKEHVLYTASWYRASWNIQMLICTLDVCKILGIGKPISSRFVVFLGVSECKNMHDDAR